LFVKAILIAAGNYLQWRGIGFQQESAPDFPQDSHPHDETALF